MMLFLIAHQMCIRREGSENIYAMVENDTQQTPCYINFVYQNTWVVQLHSYSRMVKGVEKRQFIFG